MRTARCPECAERVRVSSAAEVGDEITCQSCGEELEVTENEPLTLGYLGTYEEEVEEEEEHDEALDEEEDLEEDLEEGEEEDDDSF